mgnify:CR=1 FL=1
MLVGCKDLVCRLQRPRAGNPHLRGCTGWLWHLPRGWVPTAQLSSCPGRIGRASWSSHRSPGPSFTLRVFVHRCAGLPLTEPSILDAAENKKFCCCVMCCCVWCLLIYDNGNHTTKRFLVVSVCLGSLKFGAASRSIFKIQCPADVACSRGLGYCEQRDVCHFQNKTTL